MPPPDIAMLQHKNISNFDGYHDDDGDDDEEDDDEDDDGDFSHNFVTGVWRLCASTKTLHRR